MTIAKRYTCDQCGAERKETNHWFVVLVQPLALNVRLWEKAPRQVMNHKEAKHICGRECLCVLVSQWTEAGV